jgi:hypothetical protein
MPISGRTRERIEGGDTAGKYSTRNAEMLQLRGEPVADLAIERTKVVGL